MNVNLQCKHAATHFYKWSHSIMLVLVGTSVVLLIQIPHRITTVWGGVGMMLQVGSEDMQAGICFIITNAAYFTIRQ